MEENKNEITVMTVEESQAVQADDLVNNGLKLAQMGIAQMCAGVRMMHDGKLYKHFGFQNFEDYCKSKGFTRRHGERLIKIAEMLESENATPMSHFEKLGTAKLFQLAMLEPEQREEVIQKVDVKAISNRDLEKEIKELKTKQKQDAEKIAELESEKKASAQALDEITADKNQIASALQDKQDEVIRLERQVQELENQPRDTVFEKDPETLEEIERLKAEKEALEEQRTELELKIWDYENQEQAVSDAEEKRFAEFASNMNQQLVEERQRIKKESQEEISRANLQRDNAYLEVEKLKKQLAEQKEDSPEMKRFKVRIATLCDSIEQLVKFLCEHADSAFLDKSETVIKGAETSLSEIRKQVQA